MSYLLADKPPGAFTSSPDGEREGLCEYLSRQKGEHLRAPLELDPEASGAVVLARSARAERELKELLRGGRVQRQYLAVTDRPLLNDSSMSTARADRVGTLRHTSTGDGGSTVAFRRHAAAGHTGPYTVLEVRTSDDATDQLRRHAARLGIPLLGDGDNGGSAFPRLMLHCAKISFDSGIEGAVRHRVPTPSVMRRLGEPGHGSQNAWLTALDRRQALFPAGDGTETHRIMHVDGEGVRCDLLGEVCWFYWFRQRPPDSDDLADVADLTDEAGARHWKVQYMADRGTPDPQARRQWHSSDLESWTGTEHGLRYLFRSDRGLSPGLFLDQRRNRWWLKENAAGRRVLNLFSYTGGFGLCAAAGGAAEVVNVDTSRRTLEWSRENFALNGLDAPRLEFRPVDARSFLAGCRKRGRTFDLVICDPPSFSRGREGLFRLESDLTGIVREAAEVLAPDGSLLVSTNYESWSRSRFDQVVKGALPAGEFRLRPTPPPDWDFELPGEETILKSLLVQRGRDKAPTLDTEAPDR